MKFQYHDKNAVRKFVNQHPSLVPVLEEARNRIGEFFNDAKISLEVNSSPDEFDEKLLILVRTGMSREDTIPIIDRLRASWLRKKSKEVRQLIFVMVE